MKNRRLAPFGLQISGFVFAPFYRILLGGVSEIRTRDTLLAYTRFPDFSKSFVKRLIISYLNIFNTEIFKFFSIFLFYL